MLKNEVQKQLCIVQTSSINAGFWLQHVDFANAFDGHDVRGNHTIKQLWEIREVVQQLSVLLQAAQEAVCDYIYSGDCQREINRAREEESRSVESA